MTYLNLGGSYFNLGHITMIDLAFSQVTDSGKLSAFVKECGEIAIGRTNKSTINVDLLARFIGSNEDNKLADASVVLQEENEEYSLSEFVGLSDVSSSLKENPPQSIYDFAEANKRATAPLVVKKIIKNEPKSVKVRTLESVLAVIADKTAKLGDLEEKVNASLLEKSKSALEASYQDLLDLGTGLGLNQEEVDILVSDQKAVSDSEDYQALVESYRSSKSKLNIMLATAERPQQLRDELAEIKATVVEYLNTQILPIFDEEEATYTSLEVSEVLGLLHVQGDDDPVLALSSVKGVATTLNRDSKMIDNLIDIFERVTGIETLEVTITINDELREVERTDTDQEEDLDEEVGHYEVREEGSRLKAD